MYKVIEEVTSMKPQAMVACQNVFMLCFDVNVYSSSLMI